MDAAAVTHIRETFYAGIWFTVVVCVWAFLGHRSEDYAPTRWQRWVAAIIMWNDRRTARRAASGTPAVCVPVSQYGMPGYDMDTAPAIVAPVAPDIDAPNADMPRVSSKMSSASLIALLASLRGPDGKPQFSANAIFSFVGGDRNTVLATVREIRSGPPTPVFPPLTPEQQQNRDALGLPNKG